MPLWDDYFIGHSVRLALDHGITLHALVAQHNESRPAFPRLLMCLLHGPTQWDVRGEMAASVLLLLATGWHLSKICRRTIGGPPAIVASPFLQLVLFSLTQWQNLLWGVQLIVFVPLLALVIGIRLLGSDGRIWPAVAVSAVAAVVATFSNSNGMIVWPLLLPLVALHTSRHRRPAAVVWVCLAAATIAFYFHDYQQPPGHPPMSVAAAGAVMVVGLIAHGSVISYAEARTWHDRAVAARAVAQFAVVAPDDDAIRSTFYPLPDYVRIVIAAADRTDQFRPQCFQTNDVASIARPCDGLPGGYLDSITARGDRIRFAGWACLPPRRTPADAELLTTPDDAGVEQVFAVAVDTRLARPDVATAADCPALAQSGWTKDVDRAKLKPGAIVSAWAFDTYGRRAYRLTTPRPVPSR